MQHTGDTDLGQAEGQMHLYWFHYLRKKYIFNNIVTSIVTFVLRIALSNFAIIEIYFSISHTYTEPKKKRYEVV